MDSPALNEGAKRKEPVLGSSCSVESARLSIVTVRSDLGNLLSVDVTLRQDLRLGEKSGFAVT
jgi:hypothetical protein